MLLFFYYVLLCITVVASLGGIAYYLIAIAASRKLSKRHASAFNPALSLPPISLLKPLNGVDPGLAEYLESFFCQDYPEFEILFAVRLESDPAVGVARQLMDRYPQVPAHIIITGEPPYANAKVYSLKKMVEVAKHPLLVITDSDASVSRDYLKKMAKAFEPKDVGAVTNLYRGVSGSDVWSKLEALGMSTEFMAGVVVAERLEGMKFTLGPSMAVRADCLSAIGGFAAMADYLADDFVLGKWVSEKGLRVVLSTDVINHHASATGFINSFKHRLRWNRSSRFSRPSGYIGQGFTYGLAWAIMLCLVDLSVAELSHWSLLVLLFSILTRVWLAIELSVRLLGDHNTLSRLWLIPFQDLLSFFTWIGGFMGREIVWRNERYKLLEDGRFVPVSARLLNKNSELEENS